MRLRKDSAAYVSLSSYSLVKEHDGADRSSGPVTFTPWPTQTRHSPKRMRLWNCEQRRRGKSGVASGGAALVWEAYIGGTLRTVNTRSRTNFLRRHSALCASRNVIGSASPDFHARPKFVPKNDAAMIRRYTEASR